MRWRDAPPARAGYQRHHILPASFGNRLQFGVMLSRLARYGFDLGSFPHNGLLLPADERLVWDSGAALHRGPHHGYTDVMAARTDRICSDYLRDASANEAAAARTAMFRLHLLQNAARRALTDRHRLGFRLNRRDPMRLFLDRPYLDDAITALFAD